MEYQIIDHNLASLRGEPARDLNLIVANGSNKGRVVDKARSQYSHLPKTTLHVERRGASGKWEPAGTIEVGRKE